MMLPSTENGRPVWACATCSPRAATREVVNFAFVEEGWERDFCANENPIRLANPIASHLSVMRSSLIPGLVGTLAANRKRQIDRVRAFGRARVRAQGRQEPDARLPPGDEHRRAGNTGQVVPEQWGERARNVDFYDVKGDLEALFARATSVHPSRIPPCIRGAAAVRLDGQAIGVLGELHPVWVQRCRNCRGQRTVVFEVARRRRSRPACPAYAEISRMRRRCVATSRWWWATTRSRVMCSTCCARPRRRSCANDRAPSTSGAGASTPTDEPCLQVSMQDTRRTLEDATKSMRDRLARECMPKPCWATACEAPVILTFRPSPDQARRPAASTGPGLNKREARDMVEGFFEEIRTALERGDSVKLSGYGNFQLRRQSRSAGRQLAQTAKSRSPPGAWSPSMPARNWKAAGDTPAMQAKQPRTGFECEQLPLIPAETLFGTIGEVSELCW